MKNNTLIKLFLLFNGIILSIIAACPSHPEIPDTSIPKDNPLVLTSTSPGMISLNPSLTKLSVAMTVTLDEECPAGDIWNLFALTVHPEGDSETDMLRFYIDCDTFDVYAYGIWWGTDSQIIWEIFEGESRTVNLYFSMDLAAKQLWIEYNSADTWNFKWLYGGIARLLQGGEEPEFDETTKLYLCSDSVDAASALACTVSRLQLLPIYEGDYENSNSNHLGDFTPVTQAFYPLMSGDLTSIINPEDSAYFGNSASSPTAGSSPSWDESNSYVQITEKTQFLTLPLPPMVENSIIPPSMTIAFWIRPTSLPHVYTQLFSIIMDDGHAGFSVEVDKDSSKVSAASSFAPYELTLSDDISLALDTWQLVSCSFYFAPTRLSIALTVGDSKAFTSGSGFGTKVPTNLRIGGSLNSVIGDISAVRVLSPGVSYLTDTDICSANNAIEINSGPYAILCAEDFSFNPYDNKCYSSCPEPYTAVAPSEDAPFTLCFTPNANTGEVEAEESGGLSDGAIAGIAIGSLAGVATIAAVGYLAKLKIAKVAAKKAAGKAYQWKSPTTGITNTTTNMVSP